jgi:hypothetical protein
MSSHNNEVGIKMGYMNSDPGFNRLTEDLQDSNSDSRCHTAEGYNVNGVNVITGKCNSLYSK